VGGGICPRPPARRGPPWGRGCVSSAGALPTPTHRPVGKRIPLPHPTAGKPLGRTRVEERGAATPASGAVHPSPPTHGLVGKRTSLPCETVVKTGGIPRGATHMQLPTPHRSGGGCALTLSAVAGCSPHCLLGSYKGTSSAGANSRLRPAASRVRIPLPYPTDEGPLGARLTACGEAASLPVGQGGKTRGIQRGVRAALPSSGPRVLAGYLGKRHADQSWPP